MKSLLQTSIRVTLLGVAVFFLAACPSKKPKSDGDMDGGDGSAPSIENTPMSFDATGSDSGKIAGLETIYFEYDKSNLSSETKKTIQSNVEWLKSRGNINLQIEGHCDARGSIEYNLSLGDRRARAVRDYMISLGVKAARLSVISYGKEKPLVNGDDETAYAKNRRANFVPLAP